MKRIGYIFALLVVIGLMQAEAMAQLPLTREERKLQNEGDRLLEREQYQAALEVFQELHQEYPSDPDLNFKVGVCMFESGLNKLQSFPYFEQAKAGERKEVLFYLGQCYHLLEEFGPAVKYFQKYKNCEGEKQIDFVEVNRAIEISLRAEDVLNTPSEATVRSLGLELNSPFPDFNPVVPGNDSVLLFSSMRSGSIGGKQGESYGADIYTAEKVGYQWKLPKNCGDPINTNKNDVVLSISSNGRFLVVRRSNPGEKGGDLFIAEWTGIDWTEPELLSETINSEHIESSAYINHDGNVLYFSSDRPGGYGGLDLYRVVKFGTGEWSLPMNLGPTINSPYDEESPFVSANGKMLFYSSKGHQTIGGFDVFKVEMQDDSEWSTPENMGAPINSVDDDTHFVLTEEGVRGYMTAHKHPGIGDTDLYEVILPDQTQLLTIVKGRVSAFSEQRMHGVASKITLIDDDNKTVQGVYNSASESGKYMMVLLPNINYRIIVEADGHEIFTENLSYTVQDCYAPVSMDIRLRTKSN